MNHSEGMACTIPSLFCTATNEVLLVVLGEERDELGGDTILAPKRNIRNLSVDVNLRHASALASLREGSAGMCDAP